MEERFFRKQTVFWCLMLYCRGKKKKSLALVTCFVFMCQQVLNEVTEDNLIDLGPGSPAVVSPMVGNSAPPSSLSSQLAGLGEYLV